MAFTPANTLKGTRAGVQLTRLDSGFHPQGAGHDCKAAKAATTMHRRNDETSNFIWPDQ
jgi:hypothetical protein